jgi:hypothetical protein
MIPKNGEEGFYLRCLGTTNISGTTDICKKKHREPLL